MSLVAVDFNNEINIVPEHKFSVLRQLIDETKGKVDKETKKTNRRKKFPKNRIVRPKMTNEQTDIVLTDLQEKAFSLNKGKEKQLKSFVNNYMNNLSLIDLEKLKKQLSDFSDLYKIVDLNLPDSNNMQNLLKMCENFKDEKISEFLYALIINTIILPSDKDKNLFDTRLFGILARFDMGVLNKILVSNLNSPIVFRNIDTESILRIFDEEGIYSCYGNKELNSDTITNFGFNFDLSNLEDYEVEDRIKFDFTFKYSNGKGIDKNTLDSFFKQSGLKKIGDRSYIIGTNEFYNIYANITEVYTNKPLDEENDFSEDEIEKFNLEIFAKAKIGSLKSSDFLNEVLYSLPTFLEPFLKNIFEQFKDLLGEDYYKRDVIDVNSLVRYTDQDLFMSEEEGASQDMLELGGNTDTDNLLGVLDLTKLKPKKLLLKPDLEELVDGVIDNISNIENYKKLGLRYPKGVLFFGNGGGGKTSLCNNIICLSEAPKKKAFKLNIDKLLNSLLGSSEKRAREIFKQIREARAQGYLVFLFIDEVDGLMNVRTGGSDPVSGTRSVILQELDGIDSDNDGIIILATTNHLEKLSAPFIRRFSVKANIVNPDKETIKKLFDLYFTKFYKTIPENLDLEKLYNKSYGKSAGFVEARIIEAIKYSIFKKLELNDDCFDKTINRAEFEIQEKEKVVGFN